MKDYLYYKYINSISQFNILPVTSKCNVKCIFCSHNQNPPHIEVFRIEDLTPGKTDEIIDFLDPEKPVVIGESATRIIEGEPFCNKDLLTIISKIRNNFPSTVIQITTNGLLLDENIIKKLSSLKPLKLHLSVNIISKTLREKIMSVKEKKDILFIFDLLNKYEIPFSGSIIALPHITGWENLSETIKILDEKGSEVIKLYWPSVTRYTKPELFINIDLKDLKEFYKNVKSIIKTPILLEPPLLDNLKAITEGVLKNSPGNTAGIIAGDEIISINNHRPKCRVEAYKKVNSLKNPVLKIKRKEEILTVKILKEKNEKSGITFLYDLDYHIIENIKKELIKTENPAVLTSDLAYKLLDWAFKKEKITPYLLKVENHLFGGTIGCTGLLTVEDILTTLKGQKFSHVFLPDSPFDERGMDLTGKNYRAIEEATGCKTILLT